MAADRRSVRWWCSSAPSPISKRRGVELRHGRADLRGSNGSRAAPQTEVAERSRTSSSARPSRPPATRRSQPPRRPPAKQGSGQEGRHRPRRRSAKKARSGQEGRQEARPDPPGPARRSSDEAPAPAGASSRPGSGAGGDGLVERVGQPPQRRGAVAGEGRGVHRGERAHVEVGHAPHLVAARRVAATSSPTRRPRRRPAAGARRSSAASVVGSYSRNAVNRSPQKSVPVVSSNIVPASQQWGTCGVSSQRSRWPPMSSTSPSASDRGGRIGLVADREHAADEALDDGGLRAPPRASRSSSRTRRPRSGRS